MIKLQPSDKDLLLSILRDAVTLGLVLLLVKLLGEVHGTIMAVILLIGQISLLNRRVSKLERELQISRETADAGLPKLAEKSV